MLEENLPMMVLAEKLKISYHTINNFRSSEHANQLIKKSFLYFTNLLEAEGLINEGAVFIDGTKIEADANRYTFVWRRAIEKFHEKLKGQAVELYDELIAKEVVKDLMAKNEMSGPVFKMTDDPRITRVGKLLRKTGVDEFPQFLNVFIGDMSIVGPRPPLPKEVAQYDRWQMRRLATR